MSKKISSTSKYLGISQNWPVNFQSYTKFNFFFFLFLNLTFSFNLVKRILLQIKLFILFNHLTFLKNSIELHLKITHFAANKNLLVVYKEIYNYLNMNFSLFNLILFIYLDKINWLFIEFLHMYIDYLIYFLNFYPKKLLNFLIVLLKEQLNTNKCLFLNSGFKKTQLKGFKIQLKGRYESSKSTLAKIINFRFGRITTNSFDNNLDLLSKSLASKLGESSIKIWFFYKNF